MSEASQAAERIPIVTGTTVEFQALTFISRDRRSQTCFHLYHRLLCAGRAGDSEVKGLATPKTGRITHQTGVNNHLV